ncbi:MAG: hypothetical protein QOC89_5936, partial [Paraburkholderia sp.]|uniref:hypothetical protein n=1 Tax=Paraburkholderia sp. TaxID=1926495 RepID=UPI002B0038AD
MKDQNLPGGSAGILARLLAAIALLLVVFAANASSGDDMCFSLYAKSGAARSTKACRLDVVGNTPGGMGNYACINNLELID